jgi:hypothetical protein
LILLLKAELVVVVGKAEITTMVLLPEVMQEDHLLRQALETIGLMEKVVLMVILKIQVAVV